MEWNNGIIMLAPILLISFQNYYVVCCESLSTYHHVLFVRVFFMLCFMIVCKKAITFDSYLAARHRARVNGGTGFSRKRW